MNTYFRRTAMLAATILLIHASPASAQLLGGLLGGGDSGGGLGGTLGETLGTVVDTVVGDTSGNGIVQDVVGAAGLGETFGNGRLVDLDTTGNGQIGLTGIATVGAPGGNAKAVVLGGGGPTPSLSLGRLIGGNVGIGVELPGSLGTIVNMPGRPGQPGAPGAPGANGNNGRSVGWPAGGGATAAPHLSNSRLKLLAQVLRNRAWLRFAQGDKVCLPQFGVANVASWVRPGDQAGLQQLLGMHAGDIAALQQMLKRCRNGQSRLVDVGRVIGVDFKDGQVVVMTL